VGAGDGDEEIKVLLVEMGNGEVQFDEDCEAYVIMGRLKIIPPDTTTTPES
jgi:hypothetical protein